MKNTAIIIFCAVLLVSISACVKRPPDEPARTILSYSEPIVNPPDDFLILFNNLSIGQKYTEITFSANEVWEVEKLGDGRYSLLISNFIENFPIQSIDSIGFEGGKKYQIVVNNVYYSESSVFFVGMKKLDLSYDDFEPKF